jgi:hypothetical protein
MLGREDGWRGQSMELFIPVELKKAVCGVMGGSVKAIQLREDGPQLRDE